jgi:hypothetical protein
MVRFILSDGFGISFFLPELFNGDFYCNDLENSAERFKGGRPPLPFNSLFLPELLLEPRLLLLLKLALRSSMLVLFGEER